MRFVGEMQKRGNNKGKDAGKNAGNREISSPLGGNACEPITTKINVLVGPTDIVTHTENMV